MNQCKATTKSGEQCRAPALKDGDGYCYWHSPSRATERKAAQAFGGRRGRRDFGPPKQRVPKTNVADLSRLRDPVYLAEHVVTIRRPDKSLGHVQLSQQQREVLSKLSDPALRTVAVVWPKRSGKTLLASLALLAAAFEPDSVSVCLSNSERQAASLAFSRVKDMIRRSPVLAAQAEMTATEIRFPWHSKIVAVPCNARTVTGLTVNFLHCDELWASPDETVYFLLASQCEQGRVLLTSQPSGHESHVYNLWETFDKGEADSSLWCDYISYPTVQAAAENYPNPYIDHAFLKARQAELPANVFANYFLGTWGTPGTLFRPDVVERVFDEHLREHITPEGHTYILGLDLGLTKDRAARAILHWAKGGLHVDSIRLWEGVDFATGEVEIGAVEADLLACHKTFRLCKAVLDPWQLKSTTQRLEHQLPLEQFTFSAQSVARLSQQVFSLVNEGRLHCYPHPEFRQELLGLVAQPRSYGWRLDHQASGYSDITVAIGMAALQMADLREGSTKLIGMPVSFDRYEPTYFGKEPARGRVRRTNAFGESYYVDYD